MSDNKVIRTTVLATRSYVMNDTKFVVQTADGSRKASWNTLMRTLTSTLPTFTPPPTTPPPTTPPPTTSGGATVGPTTPPPTTPAPTTPPPTTTISYGSINQIPRAGSGTVGSPLGVSIPWSTGSFGSGLVEVLIANETTGGGYSTTYSATVGGTGTAPAPIPSIPGDYTIQTRITVSGHTSYTFSVVGGWTVT